MRLPSEFGGGVPASGVGTANGGHAPGVPRAERDQIGIQLRGEHVVCTRFLANTLVPSAVPWPMCCIEMQTQTRRAD
jgi:hypothetical protein